MTTIMFDGQTLKTNGSRTYTLTGELTPEAATALIGDDVPWRTVILTLAEGQRWPTHVKRGQWVSLSIHGKPMEGRVRFRRLHRLVLDAHFT